MRFHERLITCTQDVDLLVECLVLIYTPSPYSQHILIAVDKQLDPSSIPLRGNLRQEVVGWDPITSSAKDPYTVDLEQEGRSGFIIQWSLDNLGMSECYFSSSRGGTFAILPISSIFLGVNERTLSQRVISSWYSGCLP